MLPQIWLEHVASRDRVRVLEIGAFDGVSANLMLDCVFPHPESEVHTIDAFLPDPTTPEANATTRERFLENCKRGGHGDRIKLYEGLSIEVLAWMIADEGYWESFDVVFIDGSHFAKDVITDAVQSWALLKTGGLLIFDDYLWETNGAPWRHPKTSVDAFELIYDPLVSLVWTGYQRIFRKL